MIEPLPDLGLRRDVKLRAGETFGPYRCEVFDAAQAPYALTGATLGGDVWPRATPGSTTALTVQLATGVSPADTAVDYWLAAASTSSFGGGNFFDPKATYAYRVWYVDAGGNRRTLVSGIIDIASGAPTA